MAASKYSPEIVAKIVEMIETDSYTIPEICNHVGISEATYHYWKESQSEFLEAIKRAKQKFVDKTLLDCQKSLVKLVKGYEYEEKKTVMIDNGNGQPKIKEQTTTKKHVSPNLGAIIHYQTNKDPENWKNKQSTEITGKIESEVTLTPEEAAQFIKDLKDSTQA